MSSIARSTGIVALSTLASRLLGFVREIFFAKYFGATGSTDAFFVAFRIPNLLRRLVGEGALTISFIPVYTDYLVNRGEDEALALAQKTLTIFTVILSLIVFLGIFFSGEIVNLFTYGFANNSDKILAENLTAVMFPYLFFIGLVSFTMGVLNSHKYFFAPAFSPVLLNIGIISGIVFISTFFEQPLFGAAIGVLAGGIMQLLLQIPYMIKSGFKIKISFDVRHPGIKKIFSMIAPSLFGIAVYQINVLVGTVLASMLPSGSISYLYYSDRLTEMVLGVFIVSIGNVILPELSKMSAGGDFDKLKELYVKSIKAALFLAIPASAALLIIGVPIISVFFMRGQFLFIDVEKTFTALTYASLGIVSVSVLRITTPAFYSIKDTRTPVISAAVAFVINIAAGYLLMHTELKHGGLALANSISVTVQMLILLYFLEKRIGKISFIPILMDISRFLLSAALMSAGLYFISGLTDWRTDSIFSRILNLMIMVFSGTFIYFAAAYILKAKEARYTAEKIIALKNKFLK